MKTSLARIAPMPPTRAAIRYVDAFRDPRPAVTPGEVRVRIDDWYGPVQWVTLAGPPEALPSANMLGYVRFEGGGASDLMRVYPGCHVRAVVGA